MKKKIFAHQNEIDAKIPYQNVISKRIITNQKRCI
jgi:hypothetical protein